MKSNTYNLPETASHSEVMARVEALNNDPTVHGILVQLPLPEQIDSDEIINAIHELSAATEKLSDMLARRRFRHQRSDIVKSINVSYAAVDKFYRVLLRK